MLILNVQFWEGDKKQAMELVRLMADLEPKKRSDVYLLFTARFDCKHDDATIAYAAKKFNVVRHTTKRKVTGWPGGPNQMMGDSYEFCVEGARKGIFPGATKVMFIEADCVMLAKNWIDVLVKEFDDSGKLVMGAWLKFGDANVEHVNGNCIMSLMFWKKAPEIFHPQDKGGWDANLRHRILPHAHPSRYIWSDYQLGMDHNPWKGCDYLWAPKRYGCRDNVYYGVDLQPVWYHGLKVMHGIECAREKLINEPQNQAP